jgi:hypothetical protein
MTQLAPTKAERRGRPRCRDCGATMRLFGIEAHPTIDQTDLLTYVCSHRDGLQTELEPCEKLKVIPSSRMVVPIDARLQDRAFDPETTRLLGSTFDEAWKSVEASGNRPADRGRATSIRELLAKSIIALVQQGERDPKRLTESALLRLQHALK